MNKENNVPAYYFHRGENYRSYDYLGSFLDGDECTFRVWAPNAKEVYVTGDFCNWDYRKYKLERLNDVGLYECKVIGVEVYHSYKYVFITNDGREILKADPYAYHYETRPNTASKVYNLDGYNWQDAEWIEKREVPYTKPMNIYEVQLGSWKKNGEHFLSYRQLADTLVSYVKEMNYTHIELLPVTEYPYDKSWGYQATGYFAPTSRYGTPHDFMYFIDKCHQNNIGVILDWVPGHFTKDAHGLYEFDGGCCYEYSDTRKQEHKLWGTRVFDFGRNEVKSFLTSSAAFWFDKYHIDGIRVDAVSSMIYLNYNREEHESARNINGGFENLEAIEFLQRLNMHIQETFKGACMIAEESTSYPHVTEHPSVGGLGFNFKWNMGWMNDSLGYLEIDPFFRKGSHNDMTFSMTYAFSENYVLPISHDEVVHGKKSLLDKAPVSYDDKFSNLKAFLGYMYAHPGKKLTFMGIDIAQFIEWNEERELDWFLLDYPKHKDNQRFVKELNKVYAENSPFWSDERSWEGFKWNVVDDGNNNIFAFSRIDISTGKEILVVSNFSSQTLKGYGIGVSNYGSYKIILNSDAKKFGGSGLVNRNLRTSKTKCGEYDYMLKLNIPPFSTMYITKKY